LRIADCGLTIHPVIRFILCPEQMKLLLRLRYPALRNPQFFFNPP
jgi:hypothetical protein